MQGIVLPARVPVSLFAVQERSRVTTSKQPWRGCLLSRLTLHSRGLIFTRLSAKARHCSSSSNSCVTLCSTGKESRHNFEAALERLRASQDYRYTEWCLRVRPPLARQGPECIG